MAQARTNSRNAQARIGSAAHVRGRIHGEGDLVIEGRVEGDVSLRGDLTVSPGASLASDVVEAHAIIIGGTVEGTVTATGPVSLAAGSRVRGNVRGSAVTIEDGAHFSGNLDCAFDLPPELGGELRGRSAARR